MDAQPTERAPAEPLKGVGEHGDLPTSARPDREAEHGHTDETVNEASEESFPASDPPAFTHAHAGPPKHEAERGGRNEGGQG